MALNGSFALLLAGVGFIIYDAFQYRNTATRELTTLAAIVSAGCTATLSFAHERAAKETLASLAAIRK
jgi:hypothetical protein